MNNFFAAQEKLEKIRELNIQGANTRSRTRWYEEGEKCSKYFLSLEKTNGTRQLIQSLLVNGQLITSKAEILSQVTSH